MYEDGLIQYMYIYISLGYREIWQLGQLLRLNVFAASYARQRVLSMMSLFRGYKQIISRRRSITHYQWWLLAHGRNSSASLTMLVCCNIRIMWLFGIISTPVLPNPVQNQTPDCRCHTRLPVSHKYTVEYVNKCPIANDLHLCSIYIIIYPKLLIDYAQTYNAHITPASTRSNLEIIGTMFLFISL